jgi:hypothetical protein
VREIRTLGSRWRGLETGRETSAPVPDPTKAPVKLQDLRRRLYLKAKAEPTWRFWGLYAHVCKRETLWEAYQLAQENDGAPGIDGVTFRLNREREGRREGGGWVRSSNELG